MSTSASLKGGSRGAREPNPHPAYNCPPRPTPSCSPNRSSSTRPSADGDVWVSALIAGFNLGAEPHPIKPRSARSGAGGYALAPMRSLSVHLEGLVVIEPSVYPDERGFFCETYRQEGHEEAGLPAQG